MATRKRPSRGSKPDKLMKDAIMLALHREAKGVDGVKTKRFNIVAAKLVELAEDGDMSAIKEITDRIDGKAMQAVEHSGPLGGAIETVSKIVREIVRPEDCDG